MIQVRWQMLDPRATAPTQAHPGEDAGWDLYALEDTFLNAAESYHPNIDLRPCLTWISTGIAIAIPPDHYGRVTGRSSTATKGFHVIEGVMDSGYRGEQLVRVAPLWRPDHEEHAPWKIEAGTRIAQLIVQPVPRVEFVQVKKLPPSDRGTNGFGSSGR